MESNRRASGYDLDRARGNHSLGATVEQLLYEDEGNALDFKSEQYPFAGASDEQKGELIKDILAMVNSWSRANTRYILLGVREVTGGRAEVLGVVDHIPEHSLQQLVNSRVNKPVELSYHAVEIDGESVGVIAVPRQDRPAFVRRAVGKLQPNKVYLRRGSATAIADPDEVAQMGASSIERVATRTADIEVHLYNPATRDLYEAEILIAVEALKIPSPEEIPDYEPRRSIFETAIFDNKNYYRDLARYLWAVEATLPLGFHVRNVGDGAAANVTLRMEVTRNSGYTVLDTPVESPNTYGHIANSLVDQAKKQSRPYRPKLRGEAVTEVRYDLGTVQPGLSVWTDPFYLVVERPGKLDVLMSVYSDQFPIPREVSFSIKAEGETYKMSPEMIVEIAHDKPAGGS